MLLPLLAAVLPAAPPSRGDEIVVTARALPVTTRLAGQTATTIDDRAFRDTPATTIADIVRLSPGVTVIQGNGPRDVGVSIRGSNARQSFGARNIQVFEDDFPVTQPDGLARFDLTDPHAYGAVDVVRGPSSARYGNYALGGAVNFRTRAGREVDGIALGLDGGGDGYANLYATVGHAGGSVEYSLFGSYVRGDGATGHTGYRTGTVNGLVTVALGDRDRLTGKLIHNEGLFRLSTRLSYDQYRANPYQQGCATAALAAAGCGTISVLVNGVNGARIAQSAQEAGLARDDRRTIAGLRWEHDLSAALTWRTQATYDSRVVDQPTNATPFRGTFDSYNLSSDLTARGALFGMDALGFLGVFYNHLDNRSFTFNKTPAGRNGLGALVQTLFGDIDNLGARARLELGLAPDLRLVAGIGGERSTIDVRQTAYAYPLAAAPVVTRIPAFRRFWNVAPEAALTWDAARAVRLHAGVGAGYGIPQAGNLFVTPAGTFGNNTALKPQKNLGIDLGGELALADTLHAELTAYQEWFRNELVTQSAGIGLQNYTANAPRSRHRGIEFGLAWTPRTGASLRASYGYSDQHYTRFVERLSAGGATGLFDRAGRAVPGAVPHFANLRAGYDRPAGPLQGVGGFAELTLRSHYWIDNANRLRVPGHALVNLNLHYDPPPGRGRWSRLGLFASVQNLFDKTYVGSAGVVADSLDPATGGEVTTAALRGVTGSLYAGQPRTLYAGVRVKL